MKNLKKILLAASLTCALGASSVMFASCGDDEVTYTYSFNTNGGVAIADITLKEGTEQSLPTPTREGYVFEGWYTTADFSGEPVTSILAKADATYYAKWAQVHLLTLEVNGGELSTTKLYLKEGANVYEAVQNLVPTKAGLTFGAWFNGKSELSQTAKMPAGGLTLTAKYKVAYTVEKYLQNMEGTAYDKQVETGYAYVGETYTSKLEIVGYKEVKKSETVASMVLSQTASNNVFKHYFDRQKLTVTFRPNYPDVAEENDEYQSTQVVFGTKVEIPYQYTAEGYCLVGWSTSSTGKVEYKANFIDSVLYNKEADTEAATTTFIPEKTMTLYGVWAKGYTDMFGGNDYIYLLNDTVYLSRGGVFFEGEYDADDKEAVFYNAEGDILLVCRVNEDGTYVYESDVRNEKSCALYVVGGGLNEKVKILFDKYNGIKYVEEGENGKTSTSEGEYTFTEEGYYEIVFTSGEKAGQTMTIVVGTITLNNATKDAFQIRDEEDLALGKLVRFAVTSDGTISYYPNAYDITLNGFGIALYNKGTSFGTYYYTKNENGTITLQNANGQSMGVLYLIEELGMKGYMFYNEAQDQTFESANGATLTLDGVCNAEYVDGDTKLNGYYTTSSSVFGGLIVKMIANGDTYTFLITANSTEVSKEVTNEQGETETVTETVVTYEFEQKRNGYAEYYYADANGIYYAPLLVVEDPAQGKATVYGYTAEKKYVKVSVGTYVYNDETGLYVYTAQEYFDAEEALTDPVDLSTITSFVFDLDSTTTNYKVNYWYSSTTEEGSTQYVESYTSDKGAKLTLVGGFAIYAADGYVVTGTYKTSENLMQISTSAGNIYLEINEQEKTFVTLDTAPYSAYILLPNGNNSKTDYMEFDGKGGATYVIVTPAANKGEEDVYTRFVGTFEQTDKVTEYGYPIFQFTAEGKTFKYLQLATSSAVYIAPYNEEYNGEYQAENGAILTLDGFGYCATFIDVDGTRYDGIYIISSETEITLMLEDGERYFDLLNNKTFTVRATDYGSYILMDNSMIEGVYFEFDGYGKLGVYTLEENASGETEKAYVDENGTYSASGKVYTLTYTNSEKETITLVGELGFYTYGSYSYNVFIVSHKEAVRTFVNENDWSVLVLDDLGNAVKYDINGVKEEGSYTLVTDSLLYYVNSASTDACIYVYDVKEGTATEVELETRGYFTETLESLLFTEYGFAIFGGENRYYYNIEESGNVKIYRQAQSGESKNAYGFHEIDFGKFTNEQTYEGKTYYANDGYAIAFTRKAETKNDYPVLVGIDENNVENRQPLTDLTFAPSGAAEFEVAGKVNVNGDNYDCYVTREVAEDGTVSMYVTIGAYRFDIVVNYTGEDENGKSNNTYEVVGMQYVVTALSYSYMDMYYQYYSILGSYASLFVTNQLGAIELITTFDKEGNEIETYFASRFGENSGFVDLNGNLIQIEKASYEEEGNFMVVTVTAQDGYTYKFYFVVLKHRAFNAYGFINVAFTRVQALTTEDGYKVELERVITSEYGYKPGAVLTVNLSYNETAIEAESILLKDGIVYCVVRERDENDVITATEYYKLILTEKDEGPAGEEESTIVQIYQSVEVVKENIQTLYTEDGKCFVDISEKSGVMVLALEDGTYVAVKSEYDETTQTYTVTTISKKYTVKVTEGKVVITEVVEESTEEAE